jgi:type II secretory ATPase GspE/PulE/Tfp pilus assembly ATPase PilB-like protein
VLAQRLVRLICDRCKRPAQPSEYLLRRLEIADGAGPFWLGKGCRLCHQTGYRGRAGMFEILAMSPSIREGVLARRSAQSLQDIAISEGMETLREDGICKAVQGQTTLDEVLRVTAGGETANAEHEIDAEK